MSKIQQKHQHGSVPPSVGSVIVTIDAISFVVQHFDATQFSNLGLRADKARLVILEVSIQLSRFESSLSTTKRNIQFDTTCPQLNLH